MHMNLPSPNQVRYTKHYQITKPHKHTQQSITDAYQKDKIRRCKPFGNGENEGKQKSTFE